MVDNQRDIQLLSELEAYFRDRISRAQKEDIFSHTSRGVAASYAREFLQEEKAKILQEAKWESERKKTSAKEVLRNIETLQGEKSSISLQQCCCQRHYTCDKCRRLQSIGSRINNIKDVAVYEWPLPEEDELANTVVFFKFPHASLQHLQNMLALFKLFQANPAKKGSHDISMLFMCLLFIVLLTFL